MVFFTKIIIKNENILFSLRRRERKSWVCVARRGEREKKKMVGEVVNENKNKNKNQTV